MIHQFKEETVSPSKTKTLIDGYPSDVSVLSITTRVHHGSNH